MLHKCLFDAGLPLLPTNITLHPFSAEAVNISWITGPIPDTSFTLNVTATHQPCVMHHIYQITDTFYIFSPRGLPCEKYKFQVTARNAVARFQRQKKCF